MVKCKGTQRSNFSNLLHQTEQFVEHEGGTLLFSYHNGSMYNLLKKVYPEYSWDASEFQTVPMGYWKERKHHRLFFDKLGKVFSIFMNLFLNLFF